MIEESAQVVDIEGDLLILQARSQSACGTCAAKAGCGTSVLSKVVGKKFTRFHAPNTINADIGDTVVVAISEQALVKGSLMIYLLPILSMIFFALVAEFWIFDTEPHRDLRVAASGFTGLVVGAMFSKAYFASLQQTNSFSPVVLRKIIDHAKISNL